MPRIRHAKFVHMVYRTRRHAGMIQWYRAFDARVLLRINSRSTACGFQRPPSNTCTASADPADPRPDGRLDARAATAQATGA